MSVSEKNSIFYVLSVNKSDFGFPPLHWSIFSHFQTYKIQWDSSTRERKGGSQRAGRPVLWNQCCCSVWCQGRLWQRHPSCSHLSPPSAVLEISPQKCPAASAPSALPPPKASPAYHHCATSPLHHRRAPGRSSGGPTLCWCYSGPTGATENLCTQDILGNILLKVLWPV